MAPWTTALKKNMMAFKGKNPVRSKMLVNGKILEQASHFSYLGCDVSFKFDNDIEKESSRI